MPSLKNTLLAAATASVAAASSAQVNLYYGQQGSNELAGVCATGVDYVTLAFINVTPENGGASRYAGDNFAGHCWAGNYPDSVLLKDCPAITSGLAACRASGTKVLLSIGGVFSSASNYTLSSDANAEEFADFLWGAFGPYDASFGGPRPFDVDGVHNYVDGFDLDIEEVFADEGPWNTLVTSLRSKFDTVSGDFLITAAPQCPYFDANFQMAGILAGSRFDKIWIQFYNNPVCDGLGSGFNFNDWVDHLAGTLNSDTPLFIGLPAGPLASGSGYLAPSLATALIEEYASHPSFGGVMLWEEYFAVNNPVVTSEGVVNYLEFILDLVKPESSQPSSSSTIVPTTSSTSTTVSSTSTTTTSTSITSTSTSSTISSTSSTISSTSSTISSTSSSISSSSTVSSTSSSTSSTSSSTSSSSSVISTSSSIISTSSASSSTASSSIASSSTAFSSSSTSSSSVSSSILSSVSSIVSSISVPLSTGPSSSFSSLLPTSSGFHNSTTAPSSTRGPTSSFVPSSSAPKSTSTSSDEESCDIPTYTTVSTSGIPTSTLGFPSSTIATSVPTTTLPSTILPTGSSSTLGDELTTSTVRTTITGTITSCAPTVTNCPVGSVTTKVIDLYTTVCPVSEATGKKTSSTALSTAAITPSASISTIYSTLYETVTSCAPSVANCPARVTSKVVAVGTTTVTITPVDKTKTQATAVTAETSTTAATTVPAEKTAASVVNQAAKPSVTSVVVIVVPSPSAGKTYGNGTAVPTFVKSAGVSGTGVVSVASTAKTNTAVPIVFTSSISLPLNPSSTGASRPVSSSPVTAGAASLTGSFGLAALAAAAGALLLL